MDLNFSKGKVTSDFKEAENFENIKSGESISTIFGKVQRWYPEIESCITEDGLKDALKDLPQRCYKNDSPKGTNIIPNASNTASGSYSITAGISNNSEGNYSVAIGNGNTSQKNYDVSIGFGNTVSDEYSFAIGGHNAITGCDSYALGRNNDVSGDNSYAIGVVNNVNQNFSFVLGHNLISSYAHQVILGSQNIDGDYLFILGNGKNFTRSNALTLDWDGNLWTAGDVTATDSDGNNVSLCETARIMRDSLGMIKSKNLLKNTAGTTTQNGITFTYNDDGSVTCNGTATANADYIYKITLPQNSSFILSGCPTGGSKSTYSLFARDTATWSIVYFDTGSSRTVKTGDYTTWQVVIRISNGQTVNDMTFYPMLRNADIYADDAEYEPYSDDLQTQINELRQLIMTLTTSTNTEGV